MARLCHAGRGRRLLNTLLKLFISHYGPLTQVLLFNTLRIIHYHYFHTSEQGFVRVTKPKLGTYLTLTKFMSLSYKRRLFRRNYTDPSNLPTCPRLFLYIKAHWRTKYRSAILLQQKFNIFVVMVRNKNLTFYARKVWYSLFFLSRIFFEFFATCK